MSKTDSKIRSVSGVDSRRGHAWRLGWGLLLLGLGAGCSQNEGQLTAVADSFRQEMEERNKEIAALRASEATMRTQVGQLQGQVMAQQMELEALRTKPIDVAELARNLAPLLQKGGAAAAPASEAKLLPRAKTLSPDRPPRTGDGGRQKSDFRWPEKPQPPQPEPQPPQ